MPLPRRNPPLVTDKVYIWRDFAAIFGLRGAPIFTLA